MSRCTHASSSGKPDSVLSRWSPVFAARSRSADETGMSFAGTPARASSARLRSTTARQLGTRSILVTTTVTLGHACMTFLSSVISADVSSPVASETSSTASACISVANVLAVCADRVSPTPGVSIRTSPLSSNARGMPISARTTCCDCAVACFVTWSIGTAMRSVGVWKIDPRADALRTSAADGVSACWTKVGTVVVMSSPTAQTGALSSALTS